MTMRPSPDGGRTSGTIFNLVIALCLVTATSVYVYREFAPQPPATSVDNEQISGEVWDKLRGAGTLLREGSGNQIVVLGDFECPACRSFALDVLKPIVEDPGSDISIRHVHWPLSYHRFAVPAAIASECGGKQGKFREMHDALYLHQERLGLISFRDIANSAEVPDLDAFEQCLADENGGLREHIMAERQLSLLAEGSGTPTVIINGVRLARTPTAEELASSTRPRAATRAVDAVLVQAEGTQNAALVEVSRIDGDRHLLVPIRWMVPLPNGGVAFSQDQLSQVAFVDGEAVDVHLVGGPGSGPGEFSTLARAGLRNDTLWVLDSRQRRVSLLAASGGDFLEATPFPNAANGLEDLELAMLSPVAWRQDGSMYVHGVPRGGGLSETVGEWELFFYLDPEGGIVREAMRVPSQDQIYIRRGGEHAMVTIPFSIPPHHAVSPRGQFAAAVVPTTVGVDRGAVLVELAETDGSTVYRRWYRVPTREIPRVQRDSALAAQSSGLRRAGVAELAQALERRGGLPEVFPPIGNAFVDDGGRVWFRWLTVEGERRYTVLDAAGEPLWTIPVSDGLRLLAAVDAEVWGVERGPLGVESVVLFRLAPSEKAALTDDTVDPD